MTKLDVVQHNEDLIATVARLLGKSPKQALRLAPVAQSPRLEFTVECTNIDRLDLILDNRPAVSQNVTAPSFTASLPSPAAAGSLLEAQGYRQGTLVVSTRLRVQ
jgi:hypothetical protein